MKTTITGRNMSITPGIEARIEKKTARMARYLYPETEMLIRMTKQKSGVRLVEITVPMGGGTNLRAEGSAPENLFLAIDQALDRIERQIHKHRTRLGKHIREDAFQEAELEYIEEEPTPGAPPVVRHKTFPVRPMSVEDAAVEMDMLGHSFYAFVNMETDRTNILYLRKDGSLGLLEPEA